MPSKINRDNIADFCCLFPVANIAVGGATSVTNIGKCTLDLFKLFGLQTSKNFSQIGRLFTKDAAKLASYDAVIQQKNERIQSAVSDLGQHTLSIGTGFVRALPLAGNLYAASKLNVSCADSLSITPIVATLVGVATLVSNVAKLCLDLIKSTLNAMLHTMHTISKIFKIIFGENIEKQFKLAQIELAAAHTDYNNHFTTNALATSDEQARSRNADARLTAAQTRHDNINTRRQLEISRFNRNLFKTAYGEHFKFAGIGVLRAIPVVGQVVSITRAYQSMA